MDGKPQVVPVERIRQVAVEVDSGFVKALKGTVESPDGEHDEARHRVTSADAKRCGDTFQRGSNDDAPVHDVVARSAILVTVIGVRPRFVKAVGHFGNLPGYDHAVDTGLGDFETVDDVEARHLERHRGAGGNPDLLGVRS